MVSPRMLHSAVSSQKGAQAEALLGETSQFLILNTPEGKVNAAKYKSTLPSSCCFTCLNFLNDVG